jgi:CIC family chloride channel protein
VKFLGGVAGISGGLALGREGPTIQMGGAVGQMVGQWLKVTPRERQTLIAAGAGAGLAAAFNAPLAGVIFVLEEVQRDFTPGVFTAAFIASVVADVVTRWLTGQLPVFHAGNPSTPPLTSLPAFLILGIVAGLLGVLFNRTLLGSLNLFQRLRRWPPGLTGAAVGAAVGLVAWFWPDVVGGGYRLLDQLLGGHTGALVLLAAFLTRFALTMGSYGCGAPGGIFAPLLVLGAQIGLLFAVAVHRLVPVAAPEPGAFAFVGMAAYFTAIVRAPLTGIVLIVEMTGNYALMLPLLTACFAAYASADLLGDLPIYEALLERDLLRGQDDPHLEDSLLLELTISPGAPFEGKQVRELQLPSGCILITVRRGIREHVATAELRLEAGDRVTAVVAPEAAAAVTLLREGSEPARA